MEVKVFCPCGSKYKFDVEPINERMPWPVSCPTCGADGTALANQIIASMIAANPALAAPAPAPMPIPIPAPAPVPVAAAPAPAPGGLRINKPAAAPAPPPPLATAPPPPGAPPRFTPATGRPPAAIRPQSSSSESKWKAIGGGTFGAIIVGLIAFKWIYRIYRLSHAISGVGDDPDIVAALNEAKEMNLAADNSVVLYVKNDDYRGVAQECISFWKDKQQRLYQFVSPDQQSGDGNEYQFYPAHHGYVRIMGNLSWKDPMFESTAQHLSEKFSTMVFDEKDLDSGEFVFGVYDQGTNVFHARTTIDRNDNEKAAVEHIDWAKANGCKHGSKDFNLIDANRLTKKFGMKFWDEPPDYSTNYLVLASRQK